jgi:hypothetical protein
VRESVPNGHRIAHIEQLLRCEIDISWPDNGPQHSVEFCSPKHLLVLQRRKDSIGIGTLEETGEVGDSGFPAAELEFQAIRLQSSGSDEPALMTWP